MMARTPVGTRTQERSTTALAAHIATRLARVGTDRATRDAWLAALGTRVRSNGLDRAAARAGGAIREWVLVDEAALPIETARVVVVFPGTGRRRPRLLHALRTAGFVRQLIVTRSRRDVIAVLLFLSAERDAVFQAIEKLEQPFLWEDVLEEDREVEADAWRGLVRRAAPLERLD